MKHSPRKPARRATRPHPHADILDALHQIEMRIREMTSAIRDLAKTGSH